MKKTSRSAAKKPAAKKPATKKTPTKPKRKTAESQLAQVVTRLELVADKLAQAAERLAELHAPGMEALPVPAAQPPMREAVHEHADDVEVGRTGAASGSEQEPKLQDEGAGEVVDVDMVIDEGEEE